MGLTGDRVRAGLQVNIYSWLVIYVVKSNNSKQPASPYSEYSSLFLYLSIQKKSASCVRGYSTTLSHYRSVALRTDEKWITMSDSESCLAPPNCVIIMQLTVTHVCTAIKAMLNFVYLAVKEFPQKSLKIIRILKIIS